MCKSVFVHNWRTQGIRVAEGAAMIRRNARCFSLFSPIREKSGLARSCSCRYTHLADTMVHEAAETVGAVLEG